ncbi:MAG: hypothetical protein O3A51_11080 [Verrucomicrobia bacterium]|nr:hypothetical protein [Verrucomicrobiota bacterium]
MDGAAESVASDGAMGTAAIKTAFIFLRAGVLVRNFVNRDLIGSLEKSGYHFVIFAPEPDHPFLARHFGATCFETARMELAAGSRALGSSRLRNFFVQLRRYTYGNTRFAENGCRHSMIAAFEREHIARAGPLGRLYYRTAMLMARAASRFRVIRKLFQLLEDLVIPFNAHSEYYRRYKPVMTIVTSLGFDQDTLVMREARHFGSKVVVLVKNWDVPTTRGIGGVVPDHVLVWNDIMRNEVVRYHDVPAERVSVTGISQWDDYFRDDSPVLPRAAFFERYSLSSEHRTIYFAMTTPTHYKHNITLARLLLEAIRDGRIRYPAQLLVRLHPTYMLIDGLLSDEARDELEELEKEFGPLLAFSRPTSEAHNGFIVPGESNDADLKAILTHSDVMVTVYSTQILEGLIFDLPIVNAGMFAFRDTGLPIATYETWDHIRQVLDREAVAYCYSMDEVVATVNAALEDPSTGRAARRRIADLQFLPALRGRGGEVTASKLTQILERAELNTA